MAPVKVIAIAFQRERLIIDEVDEMTAAMVASTLNDIRARNFLEKAPALGGSWWFYSAQPDEYQVKHGA